MEVDRQLVLAARRLINGANVHRINTLIFQYEVSVAMRNKGKGVKVDPWEFERRLRAIVYEKSKNTRR